MYSGDFNIWTGIQKVTLFPDQKLLGIWMNRVFRYPVLGSPLYETVTHVVA